MANSISAALVKTTPDHSDFAMLLGVADSSTYNGKGWPSWLSPPSFQEKCYFADMKVRSKRFTAPIFPKCTPPRPNKRMQAVEHLKLLWHVQ